MGRKIEELLSGFSFGGEFRVGGRHGNTEDLDSSKIWMETTSSEICMETRG